MRMSNSQVDAMKVSQSRVKCHMSVQKFFLLSVTQITPVTLEKKYTKNNFF